MESPTIELPRSGSQAAKNKKASHRRRYIVNVRLLTITVVIVLLVAPACYFWYARQLDGTSEALLQRADQLQQAGQSADAVVYYQRYLLMHPENTEVLLQLVKTYAEGKAGSEGNAHLTRLLYRAMGRAPDRSDLRLMLARNLLDSRRYEEAEVEAGKLIEAGGSEALEAENILALAEFASAPSSGPEVIAAARALDEASQQSPGDVRLAVAAASALRKYPAALPDADRDAAVYADSIVDRMVAANSQNVDALLARYHYRTSNRLPEADVDLQLALQISPNHGEALLLAAQAALGDQQESPDAEAYLRRAMDANPLDPRSYLALAELKHQAGHSTEAIELLRQVRSLGGESINLRLALVDMLTSAGHLAGHEGKERDEILGEAREELASVNTQSAAVLARMERAERVRLDNRIKLMQAKLALAEDKPALAEDQLQPIIFTADLNPELRGTREWLEATENLARIAQAGRRWDQAAAYWEKLAVAVPRDPRVAQAAAIAHLKVGAADSAISRLENYASLSVLSQPMQVLLVNAHLAKQLARSKAERNWTEFQRVLKQASKDGDGALEIVFAEVSYLMAGDAAAPDASSHPERAANMLAAAEENFADKSEFWRGAAQAYQQLGRSEEAERAFIRYAELEPSASEQASLQVALLAEEGKYDEAEQLLVELLSSLAGDERRQMQRLRLKNLIAAQRRSAAQDLVDTLIQEDSEDAELLVLGIRLALERQDLAAAVRWEDELRKQPGAEWEWRYLRALRLLNSYVDLGSEERHELAQSVSELRAQRPRWYPVIALSGHVAQLNGDPTAALSSFRLAADLGDRRTSTLEQLVTLLYQFDRISEAQEYLARLNESQPDNPLADSLAIKIAVQQNRIAEALQLAQQGVQRRPDDAMRRIWLSNLLLQNGQPQEAIEALREAAKRFPENAEVWKGLLTLFVNTNRRPEAQATISALLAVESIPKTSRNFIAAQGYEVLGDLAKAKEHYQASLADQPKNVAILLRYAQLLSRSNVAAAREQYEQAFRHDPDSGDVRRGLASLLAATGKPEDWTRAQQLLQRQSDASSGNAATNDRLRAILLSRQGRERADRLENCRAAEAILLRLMQAGDDIDVNRRLLARVYEQLFEIGDDQAALLKAREQLRHLVDRENPSPENLTRYIEFLMRYATYSQAAATSGEDPSATNDDDQGLREIFLADAESRLQDLRRAEKTSSETSTESLSSIELTVRVLQARGNKAEAAQFVADFIAQREDAAQDSAGKAQLYLSVGNLHTTLGQYEEAESWYRRLMEVAPRAYVLVVRSLVQQDKHREAAQVCSKIAEKDLSPAEAIVLASTVAAVKGSPDELASAMAAVEEIAANHGDDVELLLASAVLKASQGYYDEAIAIFRQILEIDPEHTTAMNNLATLLAEHSNQLGEALEVIERAMGLAGRIAPLLDTQGTILLKMNDYERAIACLEEATASGVADPRYHFHLAAAYRQADRLEYAVESLQLAHELGLESALLTNDDRKLLAELDREFANFEGNN